MYACRNKIKRTQIAQSRATAHARGSHVHTLWNISNQTHTHTHTHQKKKSVTYTYIDTPKQTTLTTCWYSNQLSQRIRTHSYALQVHMTFARTSKDMVSLCVTCPGKKADSMVGSPKILASAMVPGPALVTTATISCMSIHEAYMHESSTYTRIRVLTAVWCDHPVIHVGDETLHHHMDVGGPFAILESFLYLLVLATHNYHLATSLVVAQPVPRACKHQHIYIYIYIYIYI
jgi:hypothetical protein